MTHSIRKTMTQILNRIVADKRDESNIEGILVFGSYVKQYLHEKSDLDVFVLDSSLNDYFQTRQNRQGITVEYHRWPTPFFRRILGSDKASIYPKAFLFKILREGNIEYDPLQILYEARAYVRAHPIPQTSIIPLLKRALNSLELASSHITNQRDLLAEIEIRVSSENLARFLLLKKEILDINPPKYYLPLLRDAYPDFYSIFCIIHNLQMLESIQIKKNICRLQTWISTLYSQHYSPENGRHKSTQLANAETELANAEDCLRDKNYKAAELQTRYAAIYLAPLILHQNGIELCENQLNITRLLQCNHAYQRVLLSILNCYMNREKLQYYLNYLHQLKSHMNLST